MSSGWGAMEGAEKAVGRIWGLREQSPLPAVSTFSLPCAPCQLLGLPAGQSQPSIPRMQPSLGSRHFCARNPNSAFTRAGPFLLRPLRLICCQLLLVPFLQDPHPHPSLNTATL